MDEQKLINPMVIVDKLVSAALNKTVGKDTKPLQAIKITQRGIYIYTSLSYDLNNCEPIIGEEIYIYRDADARIPLDEIKAYILKKTRVKIIKNSAGDTGLRIVTLETRSSVISQEAESETIFTTAIYLLTRELYCNNTKTADKLKEVYNFRTSESMKYDAKMLIAEYQVKSLADDIVLKLYLNGYQEGVFDGFTGFLYGQTSSGERTQIAQLHESASSGRRYLSFTDLGVNYEEIVVTSATGVMGNKDRVYRYRLPELANKIEKVEYFKDIKNLKSGIILVNNSLTVDLISTVYFYDDKLVTSNPDIVTTTPIDILTMTGELPNNKNPYLMIEGLRASKDSEMDLSEKERAAIIRREALLGKYQVIITKGIDSITNELLHAADSSLVYIIDDFNNISDVQRKIEGLSFDTNIVLNRIIGIMDISRTTYFKMNNTIRHIIKAGYYCASHIYTTSMLKVDGKYENFNQYIINLLKDSAINRITINNNGISAQGETVKELQTEVSFNNVISLLSNLTEENIYKILMESGHITIPVEIDDTTYKIIAYANSSTEISVVIKKVITKYIEDLETVSDLGNIEGKLSFIINNSKVYLSDIVSTFIDNLLKNGERVLLVDSEYSVDLKSFKYANGFNLEIVRNADDKILNGIISVKKPTVLIVHKLKDDIVLSSALRICPLLKHVFITSKFASIEDIKIHYDTKENERLLKAYNRVNYAYLENCKLQETLDGE